MSKSTYEKIALFVALVCVSASLVLHVKKPELKVHNDINIMLITKNVANDMAYNTVQTIDNVYQKLEEQRIAEEAERIAREEEQRIAEEANRKLAEESTQQRYEENIVQDTTSSNIDLRSAGIVNWGGYIFTWYSQNALPGGGLNIPGRHVNSSGFVCDESGFIVAATAFGYGTTGNSPWGAWKSYDTGVSGNTIDLYTNW